MLVSLMRELLRDIGCRFKDESRDKLRLLLLYSDVTETLSREAELGRDLLTGRPLVKKHSCSLNKHGKQLSLHYHLRNMFNVRKGSVMILDDYGMPDFNDIVADFPNAIKVIRGVIRDLIRKFEPRMKQVSVTHVIDESRPLDLFFRVKAELHLENEKVPLVFETVVGDGGAVKVRR